MAEITRYDGNIKPFADDSLGTERTIFGSETQSDTLDDNINADFFRGWGIVGVNELPTKQDFNAFAYTSTALSAYLYQMGVPEWNTSQEYFTGSITNEGGTLYKALQDNTGAQPSTDGGTNWEEVGGGFNIADLTAVSSIADGDFIPFEDIDDSNLPKKITAEDLATYTQGKLPYKIVASGRLKFTSPSGIDQSFGLASITVAGGLFTVTLSEAQPDANYQVLVTAIDNGTRPVITMMPSTNTTTSFQILMTNYSGAQGLPAYGAMCFVIRPL